MSDNEAIEGADAPVETATEGTVVTDETQDEAAPINENSDDGLAVIAAKLAELGLAPEEPYAIAEVTCTALTLLTDRAARIDQELAAANAALAELASGAAEPKSAKAAKPPKVRKINADAVVLEREGDKDERDAALLKAISEAQTVELAFSNGSNEIAALEPVTIMGNAWRATMVGVQLTIPELLIHGPAPGKQGYPLAGYGLFLDGKLAAYAARGEQLQIGAGANQNVAPDIVF